MIASLGMRTLASFGITILLGACTAGEPKPEPKAKPKSTTAAKPEPAPVATPEPTPPPIDRSEAMLPPASDWWCVCYQADTKTGPESTTSCRASEVECHKLEGRIAQGGRGLVAGSLSQRCSLIHAAHPGDAIGGREAWQPSKLAGAWTSEGACLLEGVPVGDEAEGNGYSLLMHEALGDLRLGMEASEVLELLGTPKSKGEIEEEEATGDFVQEWQYPDVGLTLYMSAASRGAPQSLGSLRASSPCNLKTKRSVGLGSTWAEVDKAYGDVHDLEGLDPDDKLSYTAGSVYGGVFFFFEAGKVESIFMGAGAE